MGGASAGAATSAGLGLAFWRHDAASGCIRFGDGWSGVFGAPPPQGSEPFDSFLDRVHAGDRDGLRAALAGGAAAGLALRLAGSCERVLCRTAPDAEGTAGVWAPLPADADPAMAALRRDRDAAQAEAAFLRSALESLPDAAFLLDREGRFVIANDRVRTLFPLMADTMQPGRPFEEMLRIGLSRGAYPEALGREDDWIAEALAFFTGTRPEVERTVRLANGHWVRAVDRRLPGGGWIGLRVDISELKQSEARLAAILEGSHHGTWEWEVVTESWPVNPLMERSIDHWLGSVGYRRDDVGTTPAALFRSICQPEDLARLDAEVDRHLAGETDFIDVEVRQRHREGHWVWARVRGEICERDLSGRPLRIAGVIMDITDLKEVQLALERSARLKLQFLERISHEIRTPLNGVLGAVSLLSASVTDPVGAGLIGVAEESGDRLVTLIDRLVELTRLEDGRVELDLAPLRLDRLAEELRGANAAKAAAKGITFEVLTDLGAASPRIGDARRLREALDWIIAWAIARTGSGNVELRIRGGADGHVFIDLADSGPTMDEETRAAALEPFFHEDGNARPEDTNTTLGLWPARRLIEVMGGRLRLEPRRTSGMVLRLELPLPRPAGA